MFFLIYVRTSMYDGFCGLWLNSDFPIDMFDDVDSGTGKVPVEGEFARLHANWQIEVVDSAVLQELITDLGDVAVLADDFVRNEQLLPWSGPKNPWMFCIFIQQVFDTARPSLIWQIGSFLSCFRPANSHQTQDAKTKPILSSAARLLQPLLDGLPHDVGVVVGFSQIQVPKARVQRLQHRTLQVLLLLLVAQPSRANPEGQGRQGWLTYRHLWDPKAWSDQLASGCFPWIWRKIRGHLGRKFHFFPFRPSTANPTNPAKREKHQMVNT